MTVKEYKDQGTAISGAQQAAAAEVWGRPRDSQKVKGVEPREAVPVHVLGGARPRHESGG